MTNLLVLSSSPNLSTSVTRTLAQQFQDTFTENVPDANVIFRDLGATPPPHLDENTIGAFFTTPDQLSESQKTAIALSDTLVSELEAADIIVIASPMHNFGISSHLKVYFDHVARVGKTFAYTETGPKGLLTNKKVFVITARGGNYSEGFMLTLDQQVPYLKTFLGFLGLGDVSFIHAEGLSMGGEVREKAIEAAKSELITSIQSLTSMAAE